MSGWQNHINLMDSIIVINGQMVEACISSGVKKPIYIVRFAPSLFGKSWASVHEREFG